MKYIGKTASTYFDKLDAIRKSEGWDGQLPRADIDKLFDAIAVLRRLISSPPAPARASDRSQ